MTMLDDAVSRLAQTPEDRLRAAEFIQGVFGHSREYVLGHPDVQFPDSVRYLEYRGEIAAALVLERMALSLGCSQARAARIECIATTRPYRRQGLCRRLMDETLQALGANGTQITLIFGEPLFRTFGFEYCVPTYAQGAPEFTPPGSFIVPTSALRSCGPSAPIAPIVAADLPAVARLHVEANPYGNLSRVRTANYWQYLLAQHGSETYRVLRSGREIGGYWRLESALNRVCAREVAAVGPAACEAVLHELCAAAQERHAEAITLHTPHRSRFGESLRRRGAAEYSPDADRPTNLQLRVIDLAGCLSLLAPDFSARLRHSELHTATERHRIVTEQGAALADLCGGRVRHSPDSGEAREIAIPARQLAQLICGFRTAEALTAVLGTERDRRLIQVIFPPGAPYWHVDDL